MSTSTSGRTSEGKSQKAKCKRGRPVPVAFCLLTFALAFSPAGQMAAPRVYHAAAALPDGTVLVCGGYGAGSIRDSAERYDPAAGQFRPAGRMTVAREY